MKIDDIINTVINADCLEVIKQLPDKCIDLISTDPPFYFDELHNRGFSGKRKYIMEIENGFGSKFNPLDYLNESKRIMKKYNAYWWCSRLLVDIYIKWCKENNIHYDILIWNKLNPTPLNNNKYLGDKEYCIFMRERGAVFNKGLDFDLYRTVYNFSVQKNNGHPTPKPLDIIINQIKVSSKKNDIILDCFFGSGTTGVAAYKSGRRFIGIEKEQKYCDIANKRIQKAKESISLLTAIENKEKDVQMEML